MAGGAWFENADFQSFWPRISEKEALRVYNFNKFLQWFSYMLRFRYLNTNLATNFLWISERQVDISSNIFIYMYREIQRH